MARIHIFGASGSGCTTLGASLAERFGVPHLDGDAYLWLPTDPPFASVRERGERQGLLQRDIDASASWVLSGSVCGWGDLVIPRLTLAVFLTIPHQVRMDRLARRESLRSGITLSPADQARHHQFMDWASRYDDGDLSIRSRALHEAWVAPLPCPVLRLDGDLTNQERTARVLDAVARE